jgi:hypothetical protein
MGRTHRVQRCVTIAKQFDLKDPGDNLSECCSKLPKRPADMVGDGRSIGELERPVFTLKEL